MEQKNQSQLLPVSGAYNMRDLGGYKAAGNKYVKRNTIIRSDDLNQLTEEDLDYLARLPLRTDIDFRDHAEKEAAPDKLPSTVSQYIQLPIETGDMNSLRHLRPDNIPQMLEQAYSYIIVNARETYKEFFRILADNNNAPLLFHCSAGKDRTGIAAALFLSALGVERRTIMEDYLLSAQYIKGKYEFITRDHPELEPLTTVKKEYLEAAFHTIDHEYGGMENYLTGQLEVDMEKLRKLYTE